MNVRRSPNPVSKSQLDDASEALQQLPEKTRGELSLKQAIAEMYSDIASALSRGYSYVEVSEILKGQGLTISASTLKSYLTQVKPESPKRTKRRRKGAEDEAPEGTRAAQAIADEDDAPAPEPAKRGRKPGPAKTAAKTAAPKSSTSGRGRKKSS